MFLKRTRLCFSCSSCSCGSTAPYCRRPQLNGVYYWFLLWLVDAVVASELFWSVRCFVTRHKQCVKLIRMLLEWHDCSRTFYLFVLCFNCIDAQQHHNMQEINITIMQFGLMNRFWWWRCSLHKPLWIRAAGFKGRSPPAGTSGEAKHDQMFSSVPA